MCTPSTENATEWDFEFDAPQWEDLQREKELSEKAIWNPESDVHASWFREVHPLHEASINTDTQRKSIVDRQGNKLSLEIPKTVLPKESGGGLEEDGIKTKADISNPRSGSCEDSNNVAKKPRRCWNLDRSASLSISPECPSLPKAKQPKRNSSLTKQSNKDTSSADIDKELLAMLQTHNRRILKQRAEYDENGRRIHKGNPVTCLAPPKVQPDSQTSQARLKGKRRSVNIARPEAPKEARQKRRSCFTLSTTEEINAKTSRPTTTTNRTATSSYSKPTGNATRQKSFKTVQKQTKNTVDTENEIKELIAQHNSKLAAKKAKK